MTVASAQVKSALLLAALAAPGRSRIVQREPTTRSHRENARGIWRPHCGGTAGRRRRAVHVLGEVDLKPCVVDVPRDPSSAAFAIVAALIVPGSEITLPSILLNPRRTGLIDTAAGDGCGYHGHQ